LAVVQESGEEEGMVDLISCHGIWTYLSFHASTLRAHF